MEGGLYDGRKGELYGCEETGTGALGQFAAHPGDHDVDCKLSWHKLDADEVDEDKLVLRSASCERWPSRWSLRPRDPTRADTVREEARNAQKRPDGVRAARLRSTSPCWYALTLGAHLQQTGGAAPTGVSMSRGNTIRSGNQRFAFWDEKAGVTFELID